LPVFHRHRQSNTSTSQQTMTMPQHWQTSPLVGS